MYISFEYCIKADDEVNQSENNRLTIENEGVCEKKCDLNDQTDAKDPSEYITAVNADENDQKNITDVDEIDSDKSQQIHTPNRTVEYNNKSTATLINSTEDKKYSKCKRTPDRLALCDTSYTLITSFSPRVVGVQQPKIFSKLQKPSVTVSSVNNKSRNINEAANDDGNAVNKSMFFVDLTTPLKEQLKLRDTNPFAKKNLQQNCSNSITSKNLNSTETTTPRRISLLCNQSTANKTKNQSTDIIAETPSNDSDEVIVISSCDSSNIDDTDAAPEGTDETNYATSTPKRPPITTKPQNIMQKSMNTTNTTPQTSLLKRTILNSAKKQTLEHTNCLMKTPSTDATNHHHHRSPMSASNRLGRNNKAAILHSKRTNKGAASSTSTPLNNMRERLSISLHEQSFPLTHIQEDANGNMNSSTQSLSSVKTALYSSSMKTKSFNSALIKKRSPQMIASARVLEKACRYKRQSPTITSLQTSDVKTVDSNNQDKQETEIVIKQQEAVLDNQGADIVTTQDTKTSGEQEMHELVDQEADAFVDEEAKSITNQEEEEDEALGAGKENTINVTEMDALDDQQVHIANNQQTVTVTLQKALAVDDQKPCLVVEQDTVVIDDQKADIVDNRSHISKEKDDRDKTLQRNDKQEDLSSLNPTDYDSKEAKRKANMDVMKTIGNSLKGDDNIQLLCDMDNLTEGIDISNMNSISLCADDNDIPFQSNQLVEQIDDLLNKSNEMVKKRKRVSVQKDHLSTESKEEGDDSSADVLIDDVILPVIPVSTKCEESSNITTDHIEKEDVHDDIFKEKTEVTDVATEADVQPEQDENTKEEEMMELKVEDDDVEDNTVQEVGEKVVVVDKNEDLDIAKDSSGSIEADKIPENLPIVDFFNTPFEEIIKDTKTSQNDQEMEEIAYKSPSKKEMIIEHSEHELNTKAEEKGEVNGEESIYPICQLAHEKQDSLKAQSVGSSSPPVNVENSCDKTEISLSSIINESTLSIIENAGGVLEEKTTDNEVKPSSSSSIEGLDASVASNKDSIEISSLLEKVDADLNDKILIKTDLEKSEGRLCDDTIAEDVFELNKEEQGEQLFEIESLDKEFEMDEITEKEEYDVKDETEEVLEDEKEKQEEDIITATNVTTQQDAGKYTFTITNKLNRK